MNDKLEQDNLILAMENDKLHDEVDRLTKHNNELRLIYRRTYKRMFELGHDELAHYFMAQIDDCRAFTVETIDWYKECEKFRENRDRAINELNTILDVMKDQPTRNPIHDDWLISRLTGIEIILKGGDNNG